MIDKPLIWTVRGNVPVDSLRYEHEWEHTAEFLKLHERWYFEDGELARNNIHAYGKPQASNDITIGLQGAGIGGQQAAMA
jgi:hypothetical protein